MDTTPLEHAAIAVLVQCAVALSLGDAWAGGVAGCMIFVGREQAQAEYRWIEKFGGGKRANMPWWGGFDPRIWDVGSILDVAVPVPFAAIIGFIWSKYVN